MIDLKMSEDEKEKQAQEYIDNFKAKMKKAADEVLGDVYCNLMPHIESDSWTNYRNYLQDGFTNGWIKDDFRRDYHSELRRTIFIENKTELIDLINKDLAERVKYLENQLNLQYQRYF